MSDYARYSIEYDYRGARWSVEVLATSWQDAEARLAAIAEGTVTGRITGSVPADGWRARWFWLRNWRGI